MGCLARGASAADDGIYICFAVERVTRMPVRGVLNTAHERARARMPTFQARFTASALFVTPHFS